MLCSEQQHTHHSVDITNAHIWLLWVGSHHPLAVVSVTGEIGGGCSGSHFLNVLHSKQRLCHTVNL